MKKTFTFILVLTLLTIVGATAQNNNGNSTNTNANSNANVNATGSASSATAVGDPSVFGNNIWNVYAFNGNMISNPSKANYAGMYTENNLNLDSRTRYPHALNSVPSDANSSSGNAYTGSAIGTIHTVLYKRTGFPTGYYQINVPTLDDWGYLIINGVEVWGQKVCCQTYTNVWSGTLTSTSTIEFKHVNVALGGAVAVQFQAMNYNALPVSFSGLIVTKNGSTANIEWSTASENNNNFFTVEKSNDGVTFETVTTVKGAGNSKTVIAYNTVDNNLSNGTSYYRIKQTDLNNHSTYSAIVSIHNNNNSEVTVYPNPANANEVINVALIGMNDATITITVRDLQGMEYSSQTVAGGTESIAINNNMAAGMYIVTVSSENNLYSQKVLVK